LTGILRPSFLSPPFLGPFSPSISPRNLSKHQAMGQAMGKKKQMRHQTTGVMREPSLSWFGPMKMAEGKISWRERGLGGTVSFKISCCEAWLLALTTAQTKNLSIRERKGGKGTRVGEGREGGRHGRNDGQEVPRTPKKRTAVTERITAM